MAEIEHIGRVARQGDLMNCAFRRGFECGAEKELGFLCATDLKEKNCKFFSINGERLLWNGTNTGREKTRFLN